MSGTFTGTSMRNKTAKAPRAAGRPRRDAKPNAVPLRTESGGVVTRALMNHATRVLGMVLGFEQPADAVLSAYFREHRELGHRDRGFIAEQVYGIVRRLLWLRALAGDDATPRALLLAWLVRGAGWSSRQFEGLADADEREWLTTIKACDVEPADLAQRTDLPPWLVERLVAGHGEDETIAIAAGLNRPASLDLRVNLLKSTRDAVLARLLEEGLGAEACPLSPHGIRLADKPALNRHPLFLDGTIEVQDEGSQLLSLLMQPRRGELVVDFCAGAGGKTLHLGAMMRSTGRLYAYDVSERRLANLRPRAARAGLSNVHPVLIDSESDSRLKRMAGKADRVLVDAPCSGLGTLRRNPDLKWRQTPASVLEMVERQKAILAAAARLVRIGGRLVYATCSVLDEENEAVVSDFLAQHPDFERLDAGNLLARQGVEAELGDSLRLWPHMHGTDGFFAVAMTRNQE